MALSEAELERMVVRLVGDTTQYMKSMEEAAHATEETAGKIEAETAKIEGFTRDIGEFAEGAAKALEAFGATEALREAFRDYSDLEGIQIRLSATMKTNGEVAESAMNKYKEFSEQVERTTTESHKTVLSLLQQAEGMGKTGDQAVKLTQDAIAFGAATGHGAEAGFRLALAMQMGNVHMLRYGLGLRGVKDDAEILRIAHLRLASGMDIAHQMAGTAAGALKQLHNAYEGLNEEIGKLVAQAVLPLVQGMKSLVEWFQSLPTWIKQGVVVTMALVAAFLAVSAALTFIVPAISAVLPFVPIIAAVSAAVWALVQSLGGVDAVWKRVTDAGMAFWDWFRPIWTALVSLVQDAWSMIVSGAEWMWGQIQTIFASVQAYIVGVWDRITGGARISWTNIRDAIRDAILFAEFSLHHFGQIAEFVWTSIKLYAVTALNFILNNIVYILAGPAIVAVFAVMQINWGKLWDWMLDKVIGVFKQIGLLASTLLGDPRTWGVKLATALPAAIAAAHAAASAQSVTLSFAGVHIKALDELQAALRADWEKQGKALGQSFADFKADWLKAHPDQVAKAVEEAGKMGEAAGDAFGKHAKQAKDKWEAVAFGSAEAKFRVEQYREMLLAKTPEEARAAQSNPWQGVEAHGAEAVSRLDSANSILADIRDTLKAKPGTVVKPAGVA